MLLVSEDEAVVQRADWADLEQEIANLRAEIIRHGWSIDCPRCAALIDGTSASNGPTSASEAK